MSYVQNGQTLTIPTVCVLDVPEAPSKPQVAEVKATSVTLKWRPPGSDGGSPVTGYVVQKKERLALRWTPVNTTPVGDTIFTVTGLTQKSEYEFRVVAANKKGFGQPSEPTNSVLVKPPYGKSQSKVDSQYL